MSEEAGLLAKLLDWAWAGVLALVGIQWKANTNEMGRQRDNISKLFEKIDSHAARDEEMFRDTTKNISDGLAEMTNTIHENHTEMLKALPKRRSD